MTQVYKTRQQKIDEAVNQKNKRQTKTEKSIQVSWAINNAVNSFSEKEKQQPFEKRIELIKERYPEFLLLYHAWMLDNLPEEILAEQGDTLEEQDKGKQHLVDILKEKEYDEKPF
jgi:hypothetical protein